MSTLADRVGAGQAPAEFHPYGTGATPMTMPLARVMVSADGMTYETLQPLWTADGAPVPATSPGSWGQLYAAGRP